MNIAEKNASQNSSKRRSRIHYPGGYLLSETDLQAFIGELRVREAATVLQLLRGIQNAMNQPQEDGLMTSDVCVIRELAEVDAGEGYKEFMNRVLDAITDGVDGVLAAYKTIRRAIELLQDYPANDETMNKMREAWLRTAPANNEEA